MQRAQLAEAAVRSLQAENAEQAGQKAELGFEPGHAEEQADIGFNSPTGRNEDMHGPLSAQVSQIMFVTVTIQGRQSLRCNHVLPVLSTHGVSVRPKEKKSVPAGSPGESGFCTVLAGRMSPTVLMQASATTVELDCTTSHQLTSNLKVLTSDQSLTSTLSTSDLKQMCILCAGSRHAGPA